MDETKQMSETEKLDAGLPYDFYDPDVCERKLGAIKFCLSLKKLHEEGASLEEQEKLIRTNFGSVGKGICLSPGFNCDNGKNIFVGDDFLTNYNVTILDIMPVHIGSHVLLGPNVLISTVNHPLNPKGRRMHLGVAKPVSIGDDVWVGGNVTILPGVKIGNNVVIGAGAVVTKDIPDDSLAVGVPAKVIKTLINDVKG